MCAWQTKFLEIMDQCIPRIILAKKKYLLWLTKLTVQALRKKKMLFKKEKRSCNLPDFLKYKTFRMLQEFTRERDIPKDAIYKD